MFENIDIDSSVPVYVQIENHVQFAIASGRMKPGDQLPSIRELSEGLNVNPNTVAKAYRDLEIMGLVYTRRGMGVYVNKGAEAKCRQRCHERIVGQIHEVVAEAKAAGMTSIEVKELAKKCYATDAGAYGPTPDALVKLARRK